MLMFRFLSRVKSCTKRGVGAALKWLGIGLAVFSAGHVAALPSDPTPQVAPLNPAFVQYQQAASLLKVQAAIIDQATGDIHGKGYIPSPIDYSHMAGKSPSQTTISALGLVAYPTSFDLRTASDITSVKNQGNCGSCWTFATVSSLESNTLVGGGGSSDLSENHLNVRNGFDSGACQGGNGAMAGAYLSRWGNSNALAAGPVYESDDPYTAASATSLAGLTPRSHLQEYLVLPGRSGPTDNDNYKLALQTYGAMYIAIYADDGMASSTTSHYWNQNQSALYYDGTANPDHAVTIVGWDDKYSATNFATRPLGNGAFIVKNSWGGSWGKSGYFYVSYYDKALSEGYVFRKAESTSNYSRAYLYDPYGNTNATGFNANAGWGANVFTATTSENLQAISFNTMDVSTSYEVYIYTGVTGAPGTGTLAGGAVNTTGSIAFAGYHTVTLARTVALTAGQKFAVVVKFTTPNTVYPIPIEQPYSGYDHLATASSGQSYISSNGTSWTDLTTSVSNTNVNIRAYTSATSAVPSAPSIGAATAGNAQATVSFATPTNNGGSTITSYTVTSSPGSRTATGIASPLTVTGLSNGTAYTFTVTATNAIGTGAASAASNSVTPTASTTVPGAPSITAIFGGSGNASISFTAPASNGGSTITGYKATCGSVTVTGTASPIVVSPLINGTSYSCSVKASNAVGDGPASVTASVTPSAPVTNPSAPTMGSAVASNAQATVSFTPPTSTGGSPIISYTVTSSPGALSATSTASPITVTGLTNGVTYTFTVTASNVAGPGPASSSSNAVTPPGGGATVLSISTGFSGGNYGATGNMFDLKALSGDVTVNRLDLNLSASAGTVVPVRVYYKTGSYSGYEANASAWTLLGSYSATSAGSSHASSMPIDNLTLNRGQVYGIYVTSTNSSAFVYTSSASTYTNTDLQLTTGVGVYYPFGASHAYVTPRTWNGTVYYSTSGTAAPANDAFANRIGMASGTVTGSNVNATKEAGEPNHADNAGGKSVWWQWTAPTSGEVNITTVGSDFDTIMAVYTGSAVNALTLVASNDDADNAGGVAASSVSFTAVAGTVYKIAVDGYDGDNGAVMLTIAQGAPSAPTSVSAMAGNAQAYVSFSAPTSDGGNTITSYRATSSPGNLTATGTSSPIRVPSLSNGTAYTFTVTATNSVGTSPATSATNSVTPHVISATNLLTNPGFESGTTGWSQSSTNGYSLFDSTSGLYHGGTYSAWLGGYDNATDLMYQDLTIPASAQTAYVQFWYLITSDETSVSSQYDMLTVELYDPATGDWLATLKTLSNLDATSIWTLSAPFDVSAFKGRAVRLQFTATTDASLSSSFFVDDVQLMSETASGASVSGAPTIGSATAGDTQATVSFTAPASNGGSTITSYTAFCSSGGLTGGHTAPGTSSPITVTGLTNGTPYNCTVTASNAVGTSAASTTSNSVVPHSYTVQTITFPAPSNGALGSTFTVSASTSSGLSVSFNSTTPSVCTVSGTTVTLHANGLCTIVAEQAGSNTYAAAPEVTRSFRVGGTPLDFNNDGKSDLTWMNTDGSYALWLMNSTSLLSSAVYGPYSGWSLLSGDGDFNNDGMSDLLLTNANGAAAIWLMNGTTLQSHAEYGPYSGWTLVSGNNDFNGDGKSDLLWTNANGAASIWLMDGTTVLSTVVFGPYPGWTVVSGNNDFNGDGKSDLLWKNSNGAASIWLMNGVTQLGNAGIYGPYQGWTVMSGSSDYNGDGMTDLLWTNTNGAASIWLMNGATQQGVGTYGPYAGWSVVPGRRDYNGDGKSDLLWSNSNGAASIWLMNGTAQQGIASYGPFPDWSILGGIGDYNGDGMTDLLWQNSNGAASIWLMNGTTQQGVAVHGPYPGWTPMTGTTAR